MSDRADRGGQGTGGGDDGLALFFAAARDAGPRPSAALVARVLADAGTERTRAGAARGGHAPRRAATREAFRDLWRRAGGWPVLGGMVTAALAGVWIGVSAPGALGLAGWAGDDEAAGDPIDMMPGTGAFSLAGLAEGG
ncbi:MAG: hypothetical protein ACKVPY_09410 [Paracoccaceae bacterium]